MYHKGWLPVVKQDGKKLQFEIEVAADDRNHQVTYLHVWRSGFLGRAEDVELKLLEENGNEIRIVRCQVKSRALIEALTRFTSEHSSQTFVVSLLWWINMLADVIDSRNDY